MTKAITIISCNTIFMAYYIQYDCLYFYREKEQEQKKKKKYSETLQHPVVYRRSPIQELTGLALLNFIEKTTALCFHPIRTNIPKCTK